MNGTTQSQTESQSPTDTTLNVPITISNNSSSPVIGIIKQKHLQHNTSDMDPPTTARSPSPDGSRDYDVTRMREEDFERLAVYIVPDVQCERGIANRADKTLPRSLTLKPSMVFSSPNVKVRSKFNSKFLLTSPIPNKNPVK